MPLLKEWVVTSDNPRQSHLEMDGETVPIDEPFSNGLMFPGQYAPGRAEEVAGCTCIVDITGEPDVVVAPTPEFADPAFDGLLETGNVIEGEEIGSGVNAPHWATIGDLDGVAKQIPESERQAELATQWLNDTYGFGVLMPRVAENGGLLVSPRVEGTIGWSYYGTWGGPIARAKFAEAVVTEDRVAVGFMDTVLANADRNPGNFIVSGDRLVALDHGKMFGRYSANPSLITQSLKAKETVLSSHQRGILERMLADEADIRARWSKVEGMEHLFPRIRRILDAGEWGNA